MSIINTGSFPKGLKPGVFSWADLSYNNTPNYIPFMFAEQPSTYKYEEIVSSTTFGLAQAKSEGAATNFTTEQQAYTTRATNVTWALGFAVTQEEIEDNQYAKVSEGRSRRLGESFMRTKQTVGANTYNRAFNSSYVGGDGKELLATDHPTAAGNQQNELTVAANFAESSLEDLCILIKKATDNKGNRIGLQPRRLILPSELMFEGTRVLKSEKQNDTANNAINAIKTLGVISEMIDNPYLTDTNAWFVMTNVPSDEGLIHFNRIPFSMREDVDAPTTNRLYYGRERYVFTWGNWRSLYGSPGA